MKIVKYKKEKDQNYKIFLDNLDEVILNEEVILEYNLLIKKEIDNGELNQIKKRNEFYIIYYDGLKLLKNNIKSINEVSSYLQKKDYDKEEINKVIEKLIKQGYLDDLDYSIRYTRTIINTTNKGPSKVRDKLKSLKIKDEYIEESLKLYTKEKESEKLEKIIPKLLKSEKKVYGNVLKQKIMLKLLLEGFNRELITIYLDNYSFNIDNNIYEKEYTKLLKKYERKYQDKELELKIKSALYKKGISKN